MSLTWASSFVSIHKMTYIALWAWWGVFSHLFWTTMWYYSTCRLYNNKIQKSISCLNYSTMSYHSQEKVQIFNLVYQLFYFHCYKKSLAQEGTFKNGLFPLTLMSIVMRDRNLKFLESVAMTACTQLSCSFLFILAPKPRKWWQSLLGWFNFSPTSVNQGSALKAYLEANLI